MQVSDINNVKIYNLSVGKSLPEWLPEKKRRALLKKNVDLRRRIEIIQDFDMPDISTSVQVTPDGQSIIATGTYKPRVKCFDVNNLSQKFDRCFDSEAVTFEVLTDDYSKLVFLQCDRYVEFHVAHGRHYRLRVPKYGTDMKFFSPTADLFIVGVTPDIYRLNLERGQFLTPFTSEASQINKCVINKEYKLIFTGSQEGKVDCWDPRKKKLIATLDCAFSCVNENRRFEKFPSITAMNFDGGLNMAVGTANGLVLLYDIRSDKPYLIKDHKEELPIKDIAFNTKQNLVFSMNKSIVKMWDKNTGKPYSHVMGGSSDFNNLCVVPETGLLFIANESPKIQTYYIPSIGPAPRWASFLDSLTEELEESNFENVYDDYKFVTKSEVAALGLDLEHLKRNNLLRAYMHGYFMDARLYKKATALAQPFAFEEYRKKKIKETIEKDRGARIKAKNLPQVNKTLALRLMEKTSKNNKNETNVLNDDRFKSLFINPDFEIDPNSEEYRLINPVLSKMDKAREKKLRKTAEEEDQSEEEEELEGKNSSDESSDDEFEERIEQSSEDEVEEEPRKVEVTKKQHKEVIKKRKIVERDEPRKKEISLGERVLQESSNIKLIGSSGNREMTFTVRKKKKDGNREERLKKHLEERKSVSRSMKGLKIGKGKKGF